ncbi:MAG TPA: hypothetical protein VEN81_11540 [Planctomycetota bacterium]|nr:hypothetical protein [Planctomycetota bacterium]
MIEAGALAIVFWMYCAGMSLLAKSDRPPLQSSLVQLLSIVLYVALAGAVAWAFLHAGHPLITMPALVLVYIFGVLLGVRYLGVLIGDAVERLHSAATGVGTMKIPPSYDKAEKAEHEGDLDRALGLYAEQASLHPEDPEPLRRMGELQLRKGRVPEGLELLRRAFAGVVEPEPRSTLAFRLSDLLAREGRRDEAETVLRALELELAGTRFATYAQERREALGPSASPTRNGITPR